MITFLLIPDRFQSFLRFEKKVFPTDRPTNAHSLIIDSYIVALTHLKTRNGPRDKRTDGQTDTLLQLATKNSFPLFDLLQKRRPL